MRGRESEGGMAGNGVSYLKKRREGAQVGAEKTQARNVVHIRKEGTKTKEAGLTTAGVGKNSHGPLR